MDKKTEMAINYTMDFLGQDQTELVKFLLSQHSNELECLNTNSAEGKYEYWTFESDEMVSLEANGEFIIRFKGAAWWGRKITGSPVYLDDVIQKIAVEHYGFH
ncbi:hypothetical protein [Aquamicrobium sp.]|uniref:hypothetical protein n=1 Tax=Aquamicrobium sp. TaxID=1872579 RepID=UPI00258C703A|nr:hypothetical protein [Aquamicrobium sp.]MCK9553204.1 hypothetical protein [Aquamicrobium sp.]